MKITFLGTGTSTGVPQIGCSCAVCTSRDPKDVRLRTSVLIETETARLLVDCGPDFRAQMMRVPYAPIDGVLVTHEHYDHVGGIDDLRPFCLEGSVPLYMEQYVADRLRDRLPYCFRENLYPGVPKIELHAVDLHRPFRIKDLTITPLRVMHARLPIYGYRINNIVFITDMKSMDEKELDYMSDLDLLIVNGLRQKEHLSHQSIPEACDFARRVGAKQTFLVHMSHQAGLHEEVQKTLPASVSLAYDGLVLTV